jgi:ABC-type xylose transport system substrate-binding protein
MKKNTLRMLLIIIASLALMALVACGGATPTTETEVPTTAPEVVATEEPEVAPPPEAEVTGRVGIVLPTREEPRWIQDEARFREALEAAGYEVEILFSQGDSAVELANVEQLITRGIEVLIITPHDGTAAAAAAEAARDAGVKVISYDRLIRDTDAVDYYVTFDSIAVGEAQAQYLVDQATGTDNPLYLYAGAATDNNAFLFFEGAWNVLQPKIADGTFRIVNSDVATGLQDTAELTRDEMGQIIGQITTNWDFNTAKSLAEANLTAATAADKGDVYILAPNDGTARAIADAFNVDADVSNFVVTGQDAEIASVQYIIDGLQSMTVLKDVRTLVGDAIAAAVAYLTGGEPEATNTYDNGVIEVPAKPSEVISVDQSNVQEAIIDSGYWDAEEFTGLETMGQAPEVTGRVGIVLPTREEPRWIQDEARFREALEAAGYEVEILFSQGDSAVELANVEQLITRGIEVLIITPHDGTAAAAAAEAARDAGVKVISYDRLIRDTDAVDYYVTFDSIAVGEAQAQYLVDQATGTDNPLYLYAGAATDNNAFLFFEGAWNVLQPKIADGTFRIVNSDVATGLQDTAELTRDEMGQIIGQITTNWDFNTAKSLAEANLTAATAADKGDVYILAPNDGTARAIADAFNVDADVSNFVVTGQDAEIASVQYIIDGLQSMTVLKDVRTLVGDAIAAAVAYLTGGEPEATNTYDNGVIEVPAKPSEVISVDQSNVQEAIIDSGYWDAEEFTGLDG